MYFRSAVEAECQHGKCFFITEQGHKNYADAQAACNQLFEGAVAVEITSVELQDMVMEYARSKITGSGESFWTGGVYNVSGMFALFFSPNASVRFM